MFINVRAGLSKGFGDLVNHSLTDQAHQGMSKAGNKIGESFCCARSANPALQALRKQSRSCLLEQIEQIAETDTECLHVHAQIR